MRKAHPPPPPPSPSRPSPFVGLGGRDTPTSRTCGSLHRRSTAPPPPSRRSYTAAVALLPPGATAPRPSPSGRHRAPLVTATLAEPHRGRFHAAATSDPFWGVRSPSHPPPGLALQAAAILRVAPLPPAPSTRDPRVSRGWSSLCTVAASACRLSAEAARGRRAGVRAATPTAEGLRGYRDRHIRVCTAVLFGTRWSVRTEHVERQRQTKIRPLGGLCALCSVGRRGSGASWGDEMRHASLACGPHSSLI